MFTCPWLRLSAGIWLLEQQGPGDQRSEIRNIGLAQILLRRSTSGGKLDGKRMTATAEPSGKKSELIKTFGESESGSLRG